MTGDELFYFVWVPMLIVFIIVFAIIDDRITKKYGESRND